MLASFEKTADHLFDAAYFGQKDSVCGESLGLVSRGGRMAHYCKLKRGAEHLLKLVEVGVGDATAMEQPLQRQCFSTHLLSQSCWLWPGRGSLI